MPNPVRLIGVDSRVYGKTASLAYRHNTKLAKTDFTQ
jgi:hypothetical protein